MLIYFLCIFLYIRLMMKNLLGKLIISVLIILLLNSNPVIRVTAEQNVPEEVRLYLSGGENVEQYIRVTYSPPPQDSTSPPPKLDLIYYMIKKNDKSTGEYIVWDNVKKAVVGGYKWPTEFSWNSYKMILSYLEQDSILKFLSKSSVQLEKLKEDVSQLKSSSSELMRDLQMQKERWTILVTTIVSIAITVATAGSTLPLIIGIIGTVLHSAWRFGKLNDLVVEWDVNPYKYPAYFTTVTQLSTFTDEAEPQKRSETVLRETLNGKISNELISDLSSLNSASLSVSGVGVQVAEKAGKGLAIEYLSKLVTFHTVTTLHAVRGILGNDRFYTIFSEDLVSKAQSIAYRSLGGEDLLGVDKSAFTNVVSKLGKWFAAKFRPSALKGITKEEISNVVKGYDDMMGKIFSKDQLLKSLKGALIHAVADLATEYVTKSIINWLQKDEKELAVNAYIHSDVISRLGDEAKALFEAAENNHVFSNYGSVIQAQFYALAIKDNYEELWDLITIQSGALKSGTVQKYLGGWFRSQCGGDLNINDANSLIACSEKEFNDLYKVWVDISNSYINLEERFSRLADSYIQNMTKRLGNALPKVAGAVNIVLTLDKSSSMNDRFLNNKKIDALKEASTRLIDLFSITKGSVKVGIVSFSTTAAVELGLTNNYTLAKDAVSRLEASGSTAIGDGMRLSAQLLRGVNENIRKVIILLTDGRSNTGSNPREVLVREIIPLGIPVFTIGIGKGVIEYDPVILREIADRTGGEFYEIDPERGIDIYTLQRVFLKIGHPIVVGGKVIDQTVLPIAQAEKKEISIDASDGKSFALTAQYSGSRVSLKLYNPSGIEVTPSTQHIKVSEPGLESWVVYSPEAGIWKAEVVGEEIPSGSLPVFLSLSKSAISVNPSEIMVEIKDVNRKEIPIKIISTSSQPIRNVQITLQGELTQIARIDQNLIDLNPLESREILLKVEPPRVAGYYDGQVIVFDGWFKHNIPVKIIYNYLVIQAYSSKKQSYPGAEVNIYTVLKDSADNIVLSGRIELSINNVTLSLKDDGEGADKLANDGIYSASVRLPRLPGIYTVNILAEKQGYIAAQEEILLAVIKIPGDINVDGVVDYKDLAILARSYGTHSDEQNYYKDADINEDGMIDYKDLAILAANYGGSLP
jgi:hypothetical protein